MQIPPNWLKKRILVPLGLATAVVLALFLFGFQALLSKAANEEFAQDLERAQSFWESDLQHHAEKLKAVLATVVHDSRPAAALKAQDRKALLAHATPLFETLTKSYGISHFGFVGPDRDVLLRAQRPEFWGDSADCPVLRKAESSGEPQAGLALAENGQLVLKAVLPFLDQGKPLGFVAVAEEVEHLLRHTDEVFGVRHIVLLDKARLDAGQLAAIRKRGGVSVDRFAPYALQQQTLAAIPESLKRLFQQGRLAELARGQLAEGDAADYIAGAFTLVDEGGAQMGHLVMLRNVTGERRDHLGRLLGLGLAGLVITSFLFWFFYRTTNHTEAVLRETYRDLANSHERLQHAHEEWVDSFNSIREPIFLHDQQYRVIEANQAYADLAGMPLEAVIGKKYWEVFPKGNGPMDSCRRAQRGIPRTAHEEELRLPGGEVYLSRATFVSDEEGKHRYSVHILEDITERERMAEALRHENRARKVVSESNHALIHAKDENGLLRDICSIITGTGAYRLAWVGFGQAEGRPLEVVAWSGASQAELQAAIGEWRQAPQGANPVAVALESGEIQIAQDIIGEGVYADCANLARELGIASAVAFPLKDGRRVMGVLVIGACQRDAFNDQEIELLSELAGDLAYGVVALRSRSERDKAQEQHLSTLRKLESSLDKTVEAMATAVEMRDPYTAGHQRRVAALAVAIGKEMGLPTSQIESIKVAGMVHDIGKLYCPAEILSKPGQLSSAEFALITTHCQVGYDILRDIDFPWPVAKMVLQHHERMDGSGYPNQLKGEEILLEARIIAVADVVEAMSSHRPYRPALDDQAAVEEIAHYRGTRYDPDVVDACVRLVRDKGFRVDQL